MAINEVNNRALEENMMGIDAVQFWAITADRLVSIDTR